jgi:hypothetical protein
MTITHGYAREHRPDLKPVVWERMGSEAGGLPCVRTSGDGHTADLEMFQARAQALRAALPQAPHPRYLRADSTLDHEDQATHRRHLGLITRMPHTRGAVAEVLTPARAWDGWPRLDDPTRDQRLERCHDGRAQRGLVVSSPAADARAAATRHHARPRARETIHPPLLHRHAQRVATPEAAPAALTAWAQGWTDHPVASCHRSDHHRDARQGRPTPRLPVQASAGPIPAHVRPADAASEPQPPRQAGCGSGTTSGTRAWPDPEVSTADTRPSQVDGGCRWLNEPRCVVASVLVNKPCRIQGLLRVMTRA